MSGRIVFRHAAPQALRSQHRDSQQGEMTMRIIALSGLIVLAVSLAGPSPGMAAPANGSAVDRAAAATSLQTAAACVVRRSCNAKCCLIRRICR